MRRRCNIFINDFSQSKKPLQIDISLFDELLCALELNKFL